MKQNLKRTTRNPAFQLVRYKYFILVLVPVMAILNVFAVYRPAFVNFVAADIRLRTLATSRPTGNFSSTLFAFTINPVSNATVNENSDYTSVTPVINGSTIGSVTYSLSGSDAFDFTIDPSTGVVNMISRNYESPADVNTDNIYEVTITATDTGNNSDSEDWTVTVQDIGESASFSINNIADVLINENTVYTGITPVITGVPIGGSTPANFTVVPISDTQFYTSEKNGGTNAIFKAQTNWIVANKDALNIKYLVQLGDCVEDGDNGGNPIQWMRADTAVSIIEDPVTTHLPYGIPYGPNVGNHDQSPIGNPSGTTTFFNQYFGSARYAGRDYYGGHYGANNNNNYQLFSGGGMDFIAVNLEFDPLANPAVLQWADDLLKAYPQRRAIVSSHFIINPDASFGAQGQAIYDKLKVNANLFLMLCGHRNPNGEASRTDTFNGNTVTTLLSDFQDRPNGGNGWMRYMEFIPSENKVYVSTYSPTLKQYETDANSSFSFNYIMTSGPNPGSVTYGLSGPDASRFTVNSSTGVVSMIPRNFESPGNTNADNVYELTLTATDADGNTASKNWKVAVQDVIEPSVIAINPISNAAIDENLAYNGATPVISGTPIGSLTYALGGVDASKFTVDSSTGAVNMVAKDYGSPQDANTDNIYELILIVTDADGNTDTEDWSVNILPVPIASKSILVPVIASLTADGISTQVLTITAKDARGTNVLRGGATVSITKVSGSGSISSVTDNNNGTYTAIVTSPASTGSGTFIATLNGQSVKNNTADQQQSVLNYIPGPPSFVTSTINASQPVISPGGVSESVITIQLKDSGNNTITTGGTAVLIHASTGSLGSVTDNNDGTYSATLTRGNITGNAVINFSVNGTDASNTTVVSILNTIPVAVDDAACTNESNPVSFSISGNDTDSDGTIDPAGIDLDPAAGIQKTFIVISQGTYAINDAGILTFTPLSGYSGASTPISYTIKDNNGGISNAATISITVIPKPSVNIAITAGSQSICAGTLVTFTATPVNGGTSPVYQWKINGVNTGTNSPNFSSFALTNGDIITCTITSDPACASPITTISNSLTIIVNPFPAATITTDGPLTFFSGGNVKLTATAGTGYAYQWLKNGTAITGETSANYIATETGSYTVRITSNTCVSVSQAVSVTGVFSLPATNFNILLTGESCKGGKNGSIRITAAQMMNYTVAITGNNVSASYLFTTITEIKYLSAGTYKVCITVAGQSNYSQCYNLVITQPKDLSLYTAVNPSNNTINLKMDGGILYTIELNGLQYSTTENQITLPLQKGDNTLKISTDKECQGIITRHINLAVLYPNPVENILNINIGKGISAKATITVISLEGRLVHSGQYLIKDESIAVDLSNLRKGFYLLKLISGDSEAIYKIQKN